MLSISRVETGYVRGSVISDSYSPPPDFPIELWLLPYPQPATIRLPFGPKARQVTFEFSQLR